MEISYKDSNGDIVWVSEQNPLPSAATVDTATLATSANQEAMNSRLDVLTAAQTLFGSLAVESTQVIADYKQLDGKDTTLFNEVVGSGGVSSYQSSHASVMMQVTSNNDFVIRQSKAVHNYTSGNPLIIRLTTREINPVVGRIKRIGYFSSDTIPPYNTGLDGWCMETDPNGIDVWFRLYKFGVVTYQKKQSEWSNVAARTLDFSLFTALEIDASWLGGTATAFKFIIGKSVILAHVFENSSSGSTIYVGSPNQFIRYEIRATATGLATNLWQICSSVGSQGGSLSKGIHRDYSLRETFVNANTGGVAYLLVAVRPSSKNTVLNVPKIEGIAATADNFQLQLLLNPVISGALTWLGIDGQSYQYAKGDTVGNPSANTVTGGTVIASKYGVASLSVSEITETLERVGRQITGAYDVLALVAIPTIAGAVNLDISGTLTVESFL